LALTIAALNAENFRPLGADGLAQPHLTPSLRSSASNARVYDGERSISGAASPAVMAGWFAEQLLQSGTSTGAIG
jgi:hypothetical protein